MSREDRWREDALGLMAGTLKRKDMRERNRLERFSEQHPVCSRPDFEARLQERQRRAAEGTTLDALCKAHAFRVQKEQTDGNGHLTRSLWWDGAWMGERTTLEALRTLALALASMDDDERRARRSKEMDRADRLESKRRAR